MTARPTGASTGALLQIPPTVQGVLAARIDRLAPEEKALLQQLAVIGREFPLSLLRQVIPQPEEELYRLLSSLQRKEFLYEQPAFPEVEYIFKHALTQEVAYGSVLLERRKVLHEQTAQAIEALYERQSRRALQRARASLQRSGNTEKAVEYLQLAGQQAVQRSANAEAITSSHHCPRVAQDLAGHPRARPARTRAALTLGSALIVTKGYAAPEVGTAYTRARELCQQVGETHSSSRCSWDCGRFIHVRAESQRRVNWRSSSSAWPSACKTRLAPSGAHGRWGNLLLLGELPLAHAHLEQALPSYDPQRRSAPSSMWIDPGVVLPSLQPWLCGIWAIRTRRYSRSQEALTLAQELSHPFTLAAALALCCHAPSAPPGGQTTQEWAEAADHPLD